jgi:GntR family transcriptional regulator of gluconate operon
MTYETLPRFRGYDDATEEGTMTENDDRMTTLKPLQPTRSLAEDAADMIREQILGGGFGQGDHLVEARIAEQLNVSRGPVREAFKLLRAEGLLEEEPRRGTFVVSLSPKDVREIYGVRAAIEGRAARMVATANDPALAAELRGLLEAMEAAVRKGDAAAVFRCDLAFHDGLCRLAGNSRLHEVFLRHVPMLRSLLRLDERVYGSMDEVAHEHLPLVEAIEAGDGDASARIAEAHCDHAGHLISTYIETQQDSGKQSTVDKPAGRA